MSEKQHDMNFSTSNRWLNVLLNGTVQACVGGYSGWTWLDNTTGGWKSTSTRQVVVQSEVQLDHAGEEHDADVILVSAVTSDLNGRGIDRGLT